VRLAMNNRPTPLQVTKPVTLELRFARSLQADVASVMPGAERIGANAVSWQGTDYLDCYRAFRAMMALANW